MTRVISSLLSLLACALLVLLSLPAAGTVAFAALPSAHGLDSADEDDGDDGDDEDEDDGDDADDDADGDDDADDADGDDDADDADDADDIDAAESAEYSEEYAYFESSETFVAEEYAAWSYDVQLTSTSSSQYGYAFSAPAGGSHPKPAELGLDTSGGIEYPFIWENDGSDELQFDTIVLAVMDNGGPIDAQTFGEIAAAEDADLHEEFPTDLVAPEHHMLGNHKWVYNAYGGGEGGSEVDVFSTFEGNKYYSFYFIGTDPGSHAQQSWDQMAAIVSSFE